MKIKFNDVLFYKFKYLANKLLFLREIIRNDQNITEEQLSAFLADMDSVSKQIIELKNDVKNCVDNGK